MHSALDFYLWGKYKAFIRARAPKNEIELRQSTQHFFDYEYSHDEMIKTIEVMIWDTISNNHLFLKSLPSRWRATYHLNGDHVEKMSSNERHNLDPV